MGAIEHEFSIARLSEFPHNRYKEHLAASIEFLPESQLLLHSWLMHHHNWPCKLFEVTNIIFIVYTNCRQMLNVMA